MSGAIITKASAGESRAAELTALVALAAICLAVIYVSLLRSALPFDLLIWSESPFLTNILKIETGAPFYGAPEQVNSFVYPPGLEYLNYFILKCLHIDPADIRPNRVLVILYGTAATILLTMSLPARVAQDRATRMAVGMVLFLVAASNFTFDAVHPDNLYLLCAAACLFATIRALDENKLVYAALAILAGCLSITAKQTGALLPSAAGASLFLLLDRPLFIRGVLLAVAAGGVALAVAVLWRDEYGRFYTLDLLARHAVAYVRLFELRQELLLTLPWAVLSLAAVGGLLAAVTERDRSCLVYGLFFALGGAPSILSYLKVMGADNNLLLIKLCLALFGCYLLPRVGSVANLRVSATLLALALAVAPMRFPPNEDLYRYGRELVSAIGAAVAEKKNVLLAHGTAPLVANGLRQPPLDRANSYLELREGHAEAMSGTLRRLDEKHYDVIFLNSTWYDPAVVEAIKRNYRLVGSIPAAQYPAGFHKGYQDIWNLIEVYEKK